MKTPKNQIASERFENNRIKELREACLVEKISSKGKKRQGKLTQSELAISLGLADESTIDPGRTIRNYEDGKAINTFTVASMANRFGVSIDYLLGLSDYKNIGNKEVAEITGLSDEAIEALRKINTYLGNDTDFYKVLNCILSSIHPLIEEAKALDVPGEKLVYQIAAENNILTTIGMYSKQLNAKDHGILADMKSPNYKGDISLSMMAEISIASKIREQVKELDVFKENK